ncbi:Hypothetical protein NTJ_15866 [Nesidiocoris tenuis]|uniref:Gustatory receptor n=1 Tax=Nesidiocoris tenuis TaxID=355587 RepID=A0ABN7BFB2_9HEMI|nr:Hypothetical protein NTJ_15866 [Nesidiocoris tenuis]
MHSSSRTCKWADYFQILAINRFIGIFPFSKKGNLNIFRTVILVLFLISYSAILIGVECYVTVPKLLSIRASDKYLSAIIDFNRIIFTVISSAVMVVQFLLKSAKFRQMIKSENQLSADSCGPVIYLVSNSLARLALMAYGCVSLKTRTSDVADLISEMLLNILQLLLFLNIIQFCTNTSSVSIYVNRLIKYFRRNYFLIQKHENSRHYLELLNDIYGAQILALIMNVFVELLSRLYYVIQTSQKLDKKPKYVYYMADDLLSCLNLAYILICLMQACSSSVTTVSIPLLL